MSSKKTPFVVVPFPQVLDTPMSVDQVKGCVGDWLGESVDEGIRSFVALAEGERLAADGEMKEVMLFLIYDHYNDGYTVYENWSDAFEEAVLIDDGGERHDGRLLPAEQALARWVAGFMVKNEAAPGSHRLRYRLTLPAVGP